MNDELFAQTASAGNGGVATAGASGGAVSLGDINSGGNAGNAIAVGNTNLDPQINGGTVSAGTSENLGNAAASNSISFDSGTLQATGSFSLGASRLQPLKATLKIGQKSPCRRNRLWTMHRRPPRNRGGS